MLGCGPSPRRHPSAPPRCRPDQYRGGTLHTDAPCEDVKGGFIPKKLCCTAAKSAAPRIGSLERQQSVLFSRCHPLSVALIVSGGAVNNLEDPFRDI